MKKATLLSLVAVFALTLAAQAVVPQKWMFRTYDDFLRGKFDGVSVSADGLLSLALREETIGGPTEDFYLSFLMTPDGIGYLGTGHEGKVYRIDREGKVELFFQAPEMDVTSLAADKSGAVYAGTSPNGKIYKIASTGKAAEFFNPSERYIWNLAFEDDGNLLAAVGESGGIYEISPKGEGRQIFKSHENHVLCLKLDRGREIIAGTGGAGIVYRIAKAGRISVVFESPFEEVRTLALDLDGNIYAAAGGAPTKGKKEELPIPPAAAQVMVSVSASAAAPVGAEAAPGVPQKPAGAGAPSAAPREPGALFRISPDGVATRIWNSAEEMIYSLFWNESEKKVYFGTGPNGRVYALDQNDKVTLVFQKESEQILELQPVGVRIYFLADNPSQLGVLFPELRLSGEYISPVLDARLLASWGKISWEAELQTGAIVQFQTRSGNTFEPGPGWSEWSPPYQKEEGEQVLSPKARYLQFKTMFKSQSSKASPVVSKATIYYLQTNVAPKINRLDVLPVNEVYLKPLEQEEVILGLEKAGSEAGQKKDEAKSFMVPKKVERKGYQTITWEAEDENGDAIRCAISVRAEGEKAWRLLEEKWTESVFTFDTANFPDGVYFIKLTASDDASNPPDLAKMSEKITPALIIDNTAPAIKNVQIVREGGGLAVAFQTEDTFSPIKEAKVLVRPDDWRVVFPEDGLCDSKQESFKVKLALGAKSENLITIAVKDACGNTAVINQVF
jgi:hypothetical protein